MRRNVRLEAQMAERDREAKKAEAVNDLEKAVQLYEKNAGEGYPDRQSFERLMIIYRRQRRYKDELKTIKTAISVFEQYLEDHLTQALAKRTDVAKLKRLSRALLKKSGADTMQAAYPDPINKWIKRKEVVEKKLKSLH